MSNRRAARFDLIAEPAALVIAKRLMSRLRVEGECWVWVGSCCSKGYGHLRVNGKLEATHVVAMWLRHGAKALGADTVNHLCFNRACCNPDHLQFASHRENTLHGNGMAGRHAAKTHCSNGHEFSPANTRVHASGRRFCRTCRRAESRRRKQQQKLKSAAVAALADATGLPPGPPSSALSPPGDAAQEPA